MQHDLAATAAYWLDRKPSPVLVPPAGVDLIIYRYLTHYTLHHGHCDATAGPTAWIYAPPILASGHGLLRDVIARADAIAAQTDRGFPSVVTLQRKRIADGRMVPAMQVRVQVDRLLGPEPYRRPF